jgi:glutathione S-transferase
MDYTLVIGSKEGSSWSLRPWILMRQAGIPFTEVLVRLRQPDTDANIRKHSPTGMVPVLKHGPRTIWDSLAIAEYLNEQHPGLQLWPEGEEARAFARSIAAEMHSGYYALRYALPMEFSKRGIAPFMTPEAERDIARVTALLAQARRRFGQGGPFLFGRFSIANAMFAPIASRFTTFATELVAHGDDGRTEAWRAMMMELPAMLEWGKAAKDENMPRWMPA